MRYLSRVRLRPEIGRTQLSAVLTDRKGYGLHRLFWGLFSEGNGEPRQRDFLYREEIASEQLTHPGRRRGDPLYYILSKQPPQQDSPLFEIETKPYRPRLQTGDRLSFKLRVNAVVTRNGKRHDIVMDSQKLWLETQLETLGLDSTGSKRERKQRLLDRAAETLIADWRAQIKTGPFRQKLEQRLGRSSLLEWAIKTQEATAVLDWWRRQGERHGFAVACNGHGEDILDKAAYQRHHLPEKGKTAGFYSLDLSGEVDIRDQECFQKVLLQGIGPAKAFGCGLMLVRRLQSKSTIIRLV